MEELYNQYKALLYTLAYQLTGSAEDAEDVVQDVFVKVSDMHLERFEKPKAYLCKMVTNHCLNLLKSARKRKEVYIGPWLPEPILTPDADTIEATVVRHDLLSYAMLVLLERLTPTERAVFVLREALGFNYTDIAELIDKQEANCRKLMSRARSKMGITEEEMVLSEVVEMKWISQLVSSLEQGDVDQLLSLLAEDIVVVADGGGKVTAATRPIQTSEHVARFLVGGFKKFKGVYQDHYHFEYTNLNGNAGLVLRSAGETLAAVLIQSQRGKFARIFFVVNPDKLTRI